jgi:hypothetical protein
MRLLHSIPAGFVAVLLTVAAAQAQTPPGQVPQNQPPTPQLPPATGGAPSGQNSGKDSGDSPLSEQLSRSGGVIKPPENVDRKMEAPTPNPGPRSMPVVPPPGSPGGNPDVKPK